MSETPTQQAFCSWSGGKDSVLAYYLTSRAGLKVNCLLMSSYWFLDIKKLA